MEMRAPSLLLGVEEECPEDFLRIFESTPTVYAGFRSFSQDAIESALVLETDHELAAAIGQLASPIPGLAEPPEPDESLALGAAFDFAGVEALVSLWGRAVQQRPFTCSDYASFNVLVNGDVLLADAPDELAQLQGASVAVHALEESDRGRVHAVVGFDDPLQALSGPLAEEFGIEPGKIPRGRVAKLADAAPFSPIAPDVPGAKIIRTSRAVAVGSDSTSKATLLEAADLLRPNDGTLLLFRWNLVRWLDSPNRDLLSDDVPESINTLLTAFFSYLKRGSVAVRARPNAVTLDITLQSD